MKIIKSCLFRTYQSLLWWFLPIRSTTPVPSMRVSADKWLEEKRDEGCGSMEAVSSAKASAARSFLVNMTDCYNKSSSGYIFRFSSLKGCRRIASWSLQENSEDEQSPDDGLRIQEGVSLGRKRCPQKQRSDYHSRQQEYEGGHAR